MRKKSGLSESLYALIYGKASLKAASSIGALVCMRKFNKLQFVALVLIISLE